MSSLAASRRSWLSLALVTLLASCNLDATAPSDLDLVAPRLDSLSIHTVYLATGGAAFINAVPAHNSFRLRPAGRVPFRVRSEEGDEEWALAHHLYCPNPPHGDTYHVCRWVRISMEEGHNVADLRPFLERANAWLSLGSAGHTGVAYAFGSPALLQLALERLPTVKDAGPAGLLSHDWTIFEERYGAHLGGAVPVGAGPVVPGDGVLQTAPGSLVTLLYEQPDGEVISYSQRVP